MAITPPPIDLFEIAGCQPPPGGKVTEQEFVGWSHEDVKAEWIEGEIVVMSPASLAHADLTRFLLTVLGVFVEERELGKVLGPEFQVRLNRRTRRVPDVLFIAGARLSQLTPQHFEGAPDLIMEVVSPESAERDWHDKRREYESAGVHEYWLIDAQRRLVEALARDAAGCFEPLVAEGGRMISGVVAGFYLRREWLLGTKLPKVSSVLRELGVTA